MEKQIRKRKGEPIAELEYECRKLYDSIAIVRTHISSGEGIPGPSESEEIKHKKNSFISFIKALLKPSTIFDWIIIIVGIIAVLSGIILIIGIIFTVLQRSRRKSRPQTYSPPRKVSFEKVPPSPSEVSSSESNKTSDIEDKGIDSLRERVRKDINDIQRFNTDKTPFSSTDSPSDQLNGRENKEIIRDTIIRAAKEGLDIQEISRRYHVSIDQVSLILRVANRDNSKNN